MIHLDHYDEPSAEMVVRLLEAGQTVTTTDQAVGCVRFFPTDRHCGDCGDELREYGETADFERVAATIKNKYGRTLCPDCHDSILQQQQRQRQRQPDESREQPTQTQTQTQTHDSHS